jgi:hypothetical protein
MHVDRSRFLLLTASLAASACDKTGPAATPDTGSVDPAGDESRDPDREAEPNDTAVAGNGGGSGVWLEIEPGTEDPKEPAWGTGDCDNSVGSPKSCSGLQAPGPHCESFADTQRFCDAFPRFLQPRAAEAAVDCMLAMSGTEAICDWSAWQTCAAAGLNATCVDPASRSQCMSISSMCGGSLDVFQCQQAFAATPAREHSRVASCIQEFCEVSFCVVDMGGIF